MIMRVVREEVEKMTAFKESHLALTHYNCTLDEYTCIDNLHCIVNRAPQLLSYWPRLSLCAVTVGAPSLA